MHFPTEHYFLKGVYVRSMMIPKGYEVLGRRHRYDHVFICSKGKAKIFTINKNNEVTDGFEVEAGQIFYVKKGDRKLAMAIEDFMAVGVHPTNKKNIKKITEELTYPEKNAMLDHNNKVIVREKTCLLEQ